MREKGKELENLLAKYTDERSRERADKLIKFYIPQMEEEYPDLGLAEMDYKTELVVGIVIGTGIRNLAKIPVEDKADPAIFGAFVATIWTCFGPQKDHEEIAKYAVKYVLMHDCFQRKQVLADDEIDMKHNLEVLTTWYNRLYYREPNHKDTKKLQSAIHAEIEQLKKASKYKIVDKEFYFTEFSIMYALNLTRR